MLPVLALIAFQPSNNVAAETIELANAPASAAVEHAPEPAKKQDVSAPAAQPNQAVERTCQNRNARDIIVCGQRTQGYRVDPDITEANREVQTNERSARPRFFYFESRAEGIEKQMMHLR